VERSTGVEYWERKGWGGGVDSLGVAPRFRRATLKEVQKQPRKKQTLKRKPS